MKTKILILIILSLFSCFRLFRAGYPSMQDDIQVFRLQQFDQCLHDGQIPCRYIANGGFGYGYPLFNFYSPLPYSVAETFHLLGFSYIDSIKISFIIPSFIRTFGMYFLASSLFGTPGGFLASALFALAPYQAINTFVRGAIGEVWALSLLPLVFWSLYKKHGKLSVLFLSLLLLSHNLTLIYALPLLLLFSTITRNVKYLLRTFLWSFCLTAFYLLPAYFEKNLTTVSTMTQGYFNYIIHFTTLKELFISNFWGYSASMWGPIDGLSFNIGLFQWVIPTIVVVFCLFSKKLKHRFLIVALFIIGLFALFLTHSKSTFIWQALPFLAYFQFPWRFLGLNIFCFSLIGGAFFGIFKKAYILPVVVSLLIAIVVLNFKYFQEDLWYSKLTDSDKLNSSETVRQSGAGLMDYWPKYSQEFPKTYAPATPNIVNGTADISTYTKNSHSASATINVLTPNATINFPIVYFPNWNLLINGNRKDYQIEPKLGLIQINLEQGVHQISLNFVDTPLRCFANLFSLFALGSFIILIIREKRS